MSKSKADTRFRYYAAAPVLVAVLLLSAGAWDWLQRRHHLAELRGRVAGGETADATAAVREMAAMHDPPLAELVAAASTADTTVSAEARGSIGRLISRWERQIDSGRRPDRVARHLEALVVAIAERRTSLGHRLDGWIRTTTHDVLRLANRLPADASPTLATRAAEVLASTEGGEVHRTPEPPARAPIELNPSGLEQAAPLPAKEPSGIMDVRRLAEPFVPAHPAWQPEWLSPQSRENDGELDANLERARISASATESDRGGGVAAAAALMSGVETRELLQRWRGAEALEAASIERELVSRGFGRLSRQLVDRYFSERAAERQKLVDDVLRQPEIGVRAWLVLLAQDPNADMRLAALTVMATSKDRDLLDTAWEAALHDRDPRIAALALRLKERREAVQRR